MADREHKQADAGWHQENDALGRELDAALAKYAAAEPRAGIEDRVLANLRAERERVPDRAWWRWSVAGALAAVVVVALALFWRSGKPSHPVVAIHSSDTTPGTKEPATQVASNGEGNGSRRSETNQVRTIAAHRQRPATSSAGRPKLSQFPSPEPLSEQERILQNYVAKYPERAVLIARARSEAQRRDELEEMKAFASGDPATDSDERNDNTTER